MSTTASILRGRIRLAVAVSVMLLPVMVLASYAGARDVGAPGEFDRFGPAGAALLLGQWGSVYSDPGVQAGPFQLLPYGVAALLGLNGVLSWTVFATVLTWPLVVGFVLVLFLPRDATGARSPLWISLGTAAAACLAGFLPGAVLVGHPSQVVIPLLWVVAACLAREERFVWFGALVGLATGWEVWGILGAPLILLATRPGVLRAALGGAAVVIVAFGPFVALGSFAMFQKTWGVSGGTLVNALFPDLSEFPWTLRLVQTAVAVLAGCAVALLARHTDYGVWLVPLAIIGARLSLDPLGLNYYWIAPAVLGLTLAGSRLLQRDWAGAAFGIGTATLSYFAGGGSFVFAIVALVAVIGVAVALRVGGVATSPDTAVSS